MPNLNTRQLWRAPLIDWLKINFDGGFCPKSNGGCSRVHYSRLTGECVLAGVGNEGRIHDALTVETVACMKALELAEQHGISHIVLETDHVSWRMQFEPRRWISARVEYSWQYGSCYMIILLFQILYMYFRQKKFYTCITCL